MMNYQPCRKPRGGGTADSIRSSWCSRASRFEAPSQYNHHFPGFLPAMMLLASRKPPTKISPDQIKLWMPNRRPRRAAKTAPQIVVTKMKSLKFSRSAILDSLTFHYFSLLGDLMDFQIWWRTSPSYETRLFSTFMVYRTQAANGRSLFFIGLSLIFLAMAWGSKSLPFLLRTYISIFFCHQRIFKN